LRQSEGLRPAAGIEKLKNLDYLAIYGNKLSAKEIKRLRAALPSCEIDAAIDDIGSK
jgi:hypothetical protein